MSDADQYAETFLKELQYTATTGEKILTSKIVSTLSDECFRKGYYNFFIFTKDSEKDKFSSLGFTVIGSVRGGAALLEYDSSGIKRFRKKLSAVSDLTGGDVKGAVVMNCNPFTKGHRYLIDKGHLRQIIFL